MMNLDKNFYPEEIINRVLGLICPDRIYKEIEEPVDAVKRIFKVTVKEPVTHRVFNRVVGDFVKLVFHKGLRLSVHLDRNKAFFEAIFLLDKYYPRQNASGYEEALIDAVGHGRAGLEAVIDHLAETIKFVEKRKYIRWVFAANVDHLHWPLRCRVAATYIKQHKAFLPQQLHDPERMADSLRDLIESHFPIDSEIMQSAGDKWAEIINLKHMTAFNRKQDKHLAA